MTDVSFSSIALKVLEYVFKHPGCSIGEIASALGEHIATISRIVYNLEKKYGIIKVIKKKISEKRYIAIVIPANIRCLNDGTVITPGLLKINDKNIVVYLQIWKCPYRNICNCNEAFSENCLLYKNLPDEMKRKIREFFEYIKQCIESIIEDKSKVSTDDQESLESV